MGVLLFALACRERSPAAEAASSWAQGPVRWLMTSVDRRDLASVRTPADFEACRQRFWNRRDPDPSDPVNPLEETFRRRVADADQLYGETGVRGALTERGAALILLGPPSILRHRSRRVPALGTGSPQGQHHGSVRIREEVWVYLTQELPSSLQRHLRDSLGPLPDIALTFVTEGATVRLTEGRDLLAAARRALVVERPEGPSEVPSLEPDESP